MKKYILFYIYLIFGISAFAQTPINAEQSLGSIRADMLNEICKLKKIPDDIKKHITPVSVQDFKKKVEETKEIDETTEKIIEKTPTITSKTDTESIEQSIQQLRDFNNSIGVKIKDYDTKKFEKEISKAESTLLANTSENQTNKAKVLEKELSKIKGELEKIEKRVTNLETKINSIKEGTVTNTGKSEKGNSILLFLLLLVIVLLATWFIIKKKSSKKNRNRQSNKDLSVPITTLVKPMQADDKNNVTHIVTTNLKKEEFDSPTVKEKNKVTPASDPVVLNNSPIKTDKNAFAEDADDWIIVGASVTGNGHIASGKPCQDNHKYEYLGDGWGIAIVSDGAGSAGKSEIGSKLVAYRGIDLFKELIMSKGWQTKNELPTNEEWEENAYKVLRRLRDDMELLADKKNVPIKEFSATAIVVIHSPKGLLATHIGDGRAGYKNKDGIWLPLITPHKGEEANQTIFLPHDYWNIPFLKLSGKRVPESVVIREKIFGFVLMSDGCETTAWQCIQKREGTERYYDPNKPYTPFFQSLDKQLQSFRKDNTDLTERAESWWKFIESGNASFVRETDDKTMILGVLNL
jgi:hypothetical protein